MSRALLTALVGTAIALPFGAVAPPPVAAAGEVTLAPVADSYVDESKPTRNFGSRNEFRADSSPVLNAYLRFDLSGVSDLTAARLRLYFRSGASQGVQILSVADNSWSEASLTWNNAPALGAVVASTPPAAAGTWLEVDVSSAVSAAGPVSFAITDPSSTAVAIRSRESQQSPELIVGTPAANQNPTASFTYACNNLSCSFDASASHDPDGTISSYAWQFGSDGTGSGVNPSYTFSTEGSYDVTLTVTDDRGGTGTATQAVSVTAPPSIDGEFVVSRIGDSYRAASTTQTYNGSLKFVVESAVSQLKIVNGGTITFTAGDFDLGSDWFELFDIVNITFQGAGMGQTVLHNYTGAATDTEVFDVTGSDGMVVRDLTVNAGGPLRSTSDALDFDRGNNSTVERVEVTGSRARGIIFDGKNAGWTSEGNVVRDCVVTGIPGKGIELLASSHNLIEGCTISNVGSHGIEVNKSSTSAPQPNKPSTDNVIRNNIIDRAGENGIYVNSGDRNEITDNVITNSSQAVSSRDGIRISSADGIACDDNVVDGNLSTDNQGTKTQAWGLRIGSSLCHRTVVGTNNFDGNLSGPILDQGTGTIYAPPAEDNEAPTVPTGLTATAASGCLVNLAWNASTDNVGVAGYGIYRGGALIDSVSGSTLAYADTGVEPGMTYSYEVDAFDASGNRSARSSPDGATTPSTACSVTLLPTADSYVDASNPNTNNGTKTQIRVDGSPTVVSYLKFDATVGGTITRATLRIWVNSNHNVGFDVHASGDTSWSETGITYANAPLYGGVIGSSGPFSGGSWVEVDVTSAVSGGGALTLVLTTTSSTAMSLASRESGATAPQLVIEAH